MKTRATRQREWRVQKMARWIAGELRGTSLGGRGGRVRSSRSGRFVSDVANGTGRFILLFHGPKSRYIIDVRRIRALLNVHIVDETPSLKMLLVEGPQTELLNVIEAMRGWELTPEHVVTATDLEP